MSGPLTKAQLLRYASPFVTAAYRPYASFLRTGALCIWTFLSGPPVERVPALGG